MRTVAEFKEFERHFKFKPRLKYGWLALNSKRVLADLNRGSNSLNSISRLNIEPYSPLKPTKVGFICIGPNY